jgi:hypothetical protein
METGGERRELRERQELRIDSTAVEIVRRRPQLVFLVAAFGLTLFALGVPAWQALLATAIMEVWRRARQEVASRARAAQVRVRSGETEELAIESERHRAAFVRSKLFECWQRPDTEGTGTTVVASSPSATVSIHVGNRSEAAALIRALGADEANLPIGSRLTGLPLGIGRGLPRFLFEHLAEISLAGGSAVLFLVALVADPASGPLHLGIFAGVCLLPIMAALAGFGRLSRVLVGREGVTVAGAGYRKRFDYESIVSVRTVPLGVALALTNGDRILLPIAPLAAATSWLLGGPWETWARDPEKVSADRSALLRRLDDALEASRRAPVQGRTREGIEADARTFDDERLPTGEVPLAMPAWLTPARIAASTMVLGGALASVAATALIIALFRAAFNATGDTPWEMPIQIAVPMLVSTGLMTLLYARRVIERPSRFWDACGFGALYGAFNPTVASFLLCPFLVWESPSEALPIFCVSMLLSVMGAILMLPVSVTLGVLFGSAYSLPVRTAVRAREDPAHDDPEQALAACGCWLTVVSSVCAAVPFPAWFRVIAALSAIAGTACCAIATRRSRLRRRWLSAVARGEIAGWRIDPGGCEHGVEPLRPFYRGHYKDYSAVLLADTELGPTPYRAKAATPVARVSLFEV